MVGIGSGKRVWWLCPKGHSHRSLITDRTREKGSGCPYCGKVSIAPGINDPKTLYPELAAQWDEERNAPVKMENLLHASTYSAWWICERGHPFQARVNDRIYGKQGCPYCARKRAYPGFNDLASQMPEIAKEWDDALNAPLTAEMVTLGSGKQVWWRCDQGHVWRARVFNRTAHGNGCPECQRIRKRKAQLRYDRIMEEAQAQNAQKKRTALKADKESKAEPD